MAGLCFSHKGFGSLVLVRTLCAAARGFDSRRTPVAKMAAAAQAKGSYEHDLKIAMEAVTLACSLTKSVQRKLLANETQAKADKSPVTIADYGSQAVVSWALERQLPPGSFSLVAEEDSEDLRNTDGAAMLHRITELVNETISSKNVTLSSDDILAAIDRGKSEGGPQGRHWVLDPIDGTKGFLRGEQYAIAVALLDQGAVVLGVLGCPNLPFSGLSPGEGPTGCLFAATKGTGTMLYSMDGSLQPKQVHASELKDPALAAFCESYESAHSLQDLTANIAKMLGVKAPPIRMDSQAKYGAMARGDAAIYLRFPHKGYREKIWDHAAGSIVIEEAGGVVVDAAGRALDFSRGRYLDLDSGIIATNPALLTPVLTAVQTCVASSP